MRYRTQELVALAVLGSSMALDAECSDMEATYPEQPISLVVGYPPGGGADGLARVLAKYLSEALGQRVTVINRAGAAGNIAAATVARSAPDGYTVFLSARPNTIHKVMYGDLEYDFARDLAAVALLATTPNVVVASKDAPVTNVQDITALASAHPGALKCASPGVGSTGYLLCEIFQQETGVDMLHVPYRGSESAYMDVVGGRVDLMFSTLPSAMPYLRAGKLRGIAIMSRSGSTVPLPTMTELGLPELDLESWAGLMVPAGTPRHVIQQLNVAINGLLAKEEVRAALAELGYMVPQQPNPPSVLEVLISIETERWLTTLQAKNIRPLH